MDQPGVIASPARGHLKKRKGHFPVLVRARECRLARQVQRSRPASACCSFPTLKAEGGAYLLRGSPPYSTIFVRRANCPCCSRITCLRIQDSCAIHFNGFLGFFIDHSLLLLLHFVLLTDAAAVLVLYCRVLKKKNEHI